MAVGVFVLSMSSEANRVRILSAWNSIVNDELSMNIDTNEKMKESENQISENKVYDLIEEKLGIKALKVVYIPTGMQYSDYSINAEDGVANYLL